MKGAKGEGLLSLSFYRSRIWKEEWREKTTSDGSYPPSSLEDLLSIRLSCSSSSLSGGGEEVLTDGDNLKADVILEDVTGDDRY